MPQHPADPILQAASPIEPAPSAVPIALGRELGGDMPCTVCGYNLRGLSIRSMCPECGTLVRATILAIVDPLASELRPISMPRATAAGVVLWAGGAAAAVLMTWLPQAADVLTSLKLGVVRPTATLGVVLGVFASFVGSFALLRPHEGIPRSVSLLAAFGTAMYLPLLYALWVYHTAMDAAGGQKYLRAWSPDKGTTIFAIIACLLIAVILLCQRPAARLLVARSLLMRTGRVDRQTMAAMAIAAGLMAAGAGLGPLTHSHTSIIADAARVAGVLLIALGGVLLSIGVLGSQIDAVRIAQAIISPMPSLRQVIREGHAPRSTVRDVLSGKNDPVGNGPPRSGGAVKDDNA